MQNESTFSRFVVMSATLHVVLVALVLVAPSLLPGNSSVSWGSQTGKSGSIKVGSVETLPGIAIPSPEVVRETAPATEDKTLHPPEPAPKAKAKPKAEVAPDVLIPSKTAAKARPQPEPVAVARAGTKVDATVPANAVPGTGGQAAVPYGQTGGGSGPATFGDEAFGLRYGTYVTAMTNAIREKWQQQGISVSGGRAPRVYVTFTIHKDGKVSNFQIDQSSGNSRLDTSAHRAVAAAMLPALPRDYSGSSVDVRFYFEYGR